MSGHRRFLPWLLCLALCCCPAMADVVVIGHPGIGKLDMDTVQRVFTGRAIEVGGVAVTAINAVIGSATRKGFLQGYMNQDEDKYTAYWTVRRYIGKGTPPRELSSSEDIIRFVQANPGAIGYIDEGDMKPSLNVVLRK